MTASNRTFDTFIFDLDGTLLDTMPDLVVVTNTTLRDFGFPERTHEEIHSFVGNGGRRLIYQAVPAGTDDATIDAAFAHWTELYPRIGSKLTAPYEGMPEALASLRKRGCALGVLSNKYDGGVQDVIPQFLPGLFDAMHGECADIPRKPDPTGLLRTIRELGSTPERTAYVGDSAGDMTVAHNAGTFAIGVSWGYNPVDSLREAGADAIIDAPDGLLQFARA